MAEQLALAAGSPNGAPGNGQDNINGSMQGGQTSMGGIDASIAQGNLPGRMQDDPQGAEANASATSGDSTASQATALGQAWGGVLSLGAHGATGPGPWPTAEGGAGRAADAPDGLAEAAALEETAGEREASRNDLWDDRADGGAGLGDEADGGRAIGADGAGADRGLTALPGPALPPAAPIETVRAAGSPDGAAENLRGGGSSGLSGGAAWEQAGQGPAGAEAELTRRLAPWQEPSPLQPGNGTGEAPYAFQVAWSAESSAASQGEARGDSRAEGNLGGREDSTGRQAAEAASPALGSILPQGRWQGDSASGQGSHDRSASPADLTGSGPKAAGQDGGEPDRSERLGQATTGPDGGTQGGAHRAGLASVNPSSPTLETFGNANPSAAPTATPATASTAVATSTATATSTASATLTGVIETEATAEIVTEPVTATLQGAVRQLRLEVRTAGEGSPRTIQLEFRERSGEMELTASTADLEVAKSMQESLPDLVTRLSGPAGPSDQTAEAAGEASGALGEDGRSQQQGQHEPRQGESGHRESSPQEGQPGRDSRSGPRHEPARLAAEEWRRAWRGSFGQESTQPQEPEAAESLPLLRRRS